jgi:hypothetical protein
MLILISKDSGSFKVSMATSNNVTKPKPGPLSFNDINTMTSSIFSSSLSALIPSPKFASPLIQPSPVIGPRLLNEVDKLTGDGDVDDDVTCVSVVDVFPTSITV